MKKSGVRRLRVFTAASWKTGRDGELETVRVAYSKNPDAHWRVAGQQLQRASARDDSRRDVIDALLGRDHQREPLAFHSAGALRAVVLRDEDSHVVARPHRHRHQASIALMLLMDAETHQIAVPREAPLDVVYRQRRDDASTDTAVSARSLLCFVDARRRMPL
jgi:hypothetical protein